MLLRFSQTFLDMNDYVTGKQGRVRRTAQVALQPSTGKLLVYTERTEAPDKRSRWTDAVDVATVAKADFVELMGEDGTVTSAGKAYLRKNKQNEIPVVMGRDLIGMLEAVRPAGSKSFADLGVQALQPVH